MLLLGVVYKYKFGGYNATYYGKTKRNFKVQICEHLVISHLTANGDQRTPLMLQLTSIKLRDF